MDPERWQRVEDLFGRAVDLPPQARRALLESECAGDRELLEIVGRLLAQDGAPSTLLDHPAGLLELEDSDPMLGRRLGPWKLTSRLAVGGMGVVYRAERADGLFQQEVAVKLLRFDATTEEMVRRFELERRMLARLSHPNIARLLDGGTTEHGQPYLVMELVRGEAIDISCDRSRLPLPQRLRLFATVCHAVHYLHQNLVVHRDLKPANVMVDEHGAPRLLDFGIARLLEEPSVPGAEPTWFSARLFTPEYASPEQLAGEPVTTASDVYSLGVVLYGLLTGRKPFHNDSRSPLAWERLVRERTPTRPSTAAVRPVAATEGHSDERTPAEFAAACDTTPARLRKRLSGDLDRIVLMALRKEPERRYASAEDLAEDLERHLAGRPVKAREESIAYVSGKFVKRNRIPVAAALLALLALVYGYIAASRGESRARDQALHARIEADSFQSIATFLMDTFLRSDVIGDEQRSDALESVRRQAEHVRRAHREDPHLRANLLDALGRVAASLDRPEEAESLLREAHDLRLKTFGDRHIEVALSLGSLGALQFRRGKLAEAEDLLRRALALHRSLAHSTHTDVALAANDLAAVLRNQGSLDEAEDLHREALALRRAAGTHTPAVAESLNNLAGIHLDRGEFDAARALFEESLAIREDVLGEEHPLTVQSLSNLANVVWHSGDAGRARSLLALAEASYRSQRTRGLEGLAQVLVNLAAMDLREQELEAAAERLREARAIQVSRVGPEHPALASVQVLQAQVARLSGDPERACELLEEALRIRRAALGDASPAVGRTLQDLAIARLAAGDPEGAEAALREGASNLEAAGADPLALTRSRIFLGVALMRQGRLDEAQELLEAGLELLKTETGANAEDLEAVRAHLEALQRLRSPTKTGSGPGSPWRSGTIDSSSAARTGSLTRGASPAPRS
ncbi:MAG TPA: serine/threonine-protein kinase [Planctomycetota bacterium]|nr:serine/threonine-protein kinase [Planctomycetota bacterium]